MRSRAQETPAALVTGGGTGIGVAVARRLALAGYSVAVSGRREELLREVAGETGGVFIVGDVGVEDVRIVGGFRAAIHPGLYGV